MNLCFTEYTVSVCKCLALEMFTFIYMLMIACSGMALVLA